MTASHDNPTLPRLTLLTGGARSGKSALAERLAYATRQPVLFVATMQALDDEVRHRIQQHQSVRLKDWRTVEEPLAVVGALAAHAHPRDTVIIDCLTLWASNMLLRDLPDPDSAPLGQVDAAVERCASAVGDLVTWSASHDGAVIVVTNEVGAGVVPTTRLGRLFRDALGRANAAIAARAERVYYLNAGLALELKALGALPVGAFGDTPSE
jgi:adenosylcobinamide kinase/adenosylcobinamide-phosphate guanylyltransferase